MSSLKALLREVGFSPSAYLEDHPDLLSADLGIEAATDHFLVYGYKERRTTTSNIHCSEHAVALRSATSMPGYSFDVAKALVWGGVKKINQDPAIWPIIDTSFIKALDLTALAPYIMIGDSHSRLCVHYQLPGKGDAAPLHLLCSGGSAAGLNNINSRSQYGVRLKEWALKTKDVINELKTPTFLKFGQVDAEFVSIFKRIEKKEFFFSLDSYESFCQISVKNYFDFIDQIADLIDPDLLRICSIFPPTLSSASWSLGYVNAHVGFLESDDDLESLSQSVRKLQILDLKVRTNLHALFNAELQRQSARRNLAFINDFSALLGANCVIDDKFMVGHSGDDHHLNFETVKETIAQLIDQFY